MSLLDQFVQAAAAIADPIIGEDELVLDSGVTFRGVWSGVGQAIRADDGGLQAEVDASINGMLPDGLTHSDLIGKVGTAKGARYRVLSADIGKAFTTLFLVHATEAIR